MQNRKTKKLLTYFLTLTLVLTLCQGMTPGSAAEAAASLRSPRRDADNVVTWDCVYFGNYWQSDTNGDGTADKSDNKQPIKWRVLSVEGDDAFLVADQNLDVQRYNDTRASVTWETCTMRSWLNGYGASSNREGKDYTGDSFLENAFTAAEQAAIADTDVVNADNPEYDIEGGNNTRDKVFLLAYDEATNSSYGFSTDYNDYDDARVRKNTEYVADGGTIDSSAMHSAGSADYWWLRSPGDDSDYAMCVDDVGYLYRFGYRVIIIEQAVCPALHLDLSSSNLWSYAGTVSGQGGSTAGSGTPAPATPEPEEENSLQCRPACEVEEGKMKMLQGATAYADSRDELKSLIGDIEWTSDNPQVATVENAGYLMDAKPAVYETESGSLETWRAIGMVFVKGVSIGTATLTGTASDGSQATCRVTVTEPLEKELETAGEGSGGSLTLGEDKSGSGDGGVEQFFPSEWSLKSVNFPVEISKKQNEDGTYTIKGSVGIGKSDWLDDDAKWCKFRKNVDDVHKYSGRVDCMKKYREEWGVKALNNVETSKFEALPKLSVMGYFENTYDANGKLISNTGKLAADAKWSGSISWQFVTPVGPMYLNLSASGKLSGKIGPKYDYRAKKLTIADGSLMFTPSVALEGGYGIDKVAQIGARGTLSVPVTIVPASKGEFNAAASVHLKLLFVIDKNWELASYTNTLWDTTGQKKNSLKMGNVYGYSEGELSPMDTSFSKQTGKWNGGGKRKNGLRLMAKDGADGSGESFTTLLEGILPSSLPIQRQIGDRTVMVFQSYDEDRETLNSSRLMYSVCEDGVWSEPEAVWDNGCADLYADMKVVGDELVLVWQKEKTEISGDVETDGDRVLKDFSRNSEICCSVFDKKTGKFTDPAFVTENRACDSMPRICRDSEDIILSYVRNDETDLMQETGTNTIYTRKWNGTSWEEETELVTAAGTIDDFVVYEKGGSLETVFTGQSDGIKAVFGTEGQVLDAFTPLMQKAEDGAVTNLSYADGKVSLIKDGILYTYSPEDGQMDSYPAGESAFGATAVYCTNGEKSGYVWSIYDQETGKGSVVASLSTGDGYAEPVTLCERENAMFRYLSPVLTEDGDWHILANVEDMETGLNSLAYLGKKEAGGIDLAGASVNEADVKDGLTGVDYFVANEKDTTVDTLVIALTLADGTKVEKTVPATILPGESLAGTVYMDLSAVNGAQDIKVSVRAQGQKNTEDTETTAKAGLADISLTAAATESGDRVTVRAALVNRSSQDANVTLSLYGDEKKSERLDQSGKLRVKANDSTEVDFTVKKEDITYNADRAAYLTLEAAAEGGDYDEANNTAYVVLYQPEQEIPSPSVSPAMQPTQTPTLKPTQKPTQKPAGGPTGMPSSRPAVSPALKPTQKPILYPTKAPMNKPLPTIKPTGNGTAVSDLENQPTGGAADGKTASPLKKPVIKSARNRKGRKIKITLRKKVKGATGYQVQYAMNKKFKNTSQRTSKKKTITIKGLKKKTYYLRVRAYKKNKYEIIYSSWSKIKKVKVRK